MKAELLVDERVEVRASAFAALRLWRCPESVVGSTHPYKYRLALVVDGRCVLRYDNEAGKGDHCHHDATEEPYRFSSPKRLLEDFWRDVRAIGVLK